MLNPESGAILSDCGFYRYSLWRVWCPSRPLLYFVGLHPSTVDTTRDDPTIRRCVAFADRDYFGGIIVRNLFALMATSPASLFHATDPVGPKNMDYLRFVGRGSAFSRLVAAWGAFNGGRRLAEQFDRAVNLVRRNNPYCLGTTKNGSPRHPLCVREDAKMIPWCS